MPAHAGRDPFLRKPLPIISDGPARLIRACPLLNESATQAVAVSSSASPDRPMLKWMFPIVAPRRARMEAATAVADRIMLERNSPDGPSPEFSNIKAKFDDAQRAQAEYEDKRKNLVEMQYRLQAMELQVGAAAEEVRSLENFSLTGLLSTLRGNRQERAEEARDQLHQLQTQFDAALDAFETLQRQVTDLEARVAEGDRARAEYEAAFSAKLRRAEVSGGESADRLGAISIELQSLQNQSEMLKKAIKAGDEARRGMLEEIETLSTMGRCRVAEGHKAISMFINSALKSTYDQCAARVRQGCRRFVQRFEEGMGPGGLRAEDGTEEMHKTLRRIADQFDKNWFFSTDDFNSNGYVVGMLQNATMIVERRQNEVAERIELLTEERRKLVEG